MAKENKTTIKNIEINLIPDIKAEALKTQRLHAKIIGAISVASMAVVGVVVFLIITVFMVQAILLSNAKETIQTEFKKYKGYSNLDQIITLQNQLSKINSSHSEKIISSRTLPLTYFIAYGQNIKLSGFGYNRSLNAFVIDGATTGGYADLERLQKTILSTKISYKPINSSQQITESLTRSIENVSSPAFITDNDGQKALSFRLAFAPNPALFNSQNEDIVFNAVGRQNVTDSTLIVPQGIFSPKIKNDESEKE